MKAKKKMSQKQKIVNALRKLWSQSDLRSDFVSSKTYKVQIGKTLKGEPKYLLHVKCNVCKTESASKDRMTQVDHISPVVHKKEGFINWDIYINRLIYCDPSNLQILCKRCHAIKTKRENSSN